MARKKPITNKKRTSKKRATKTRKVGFLLYRKTFLKTFKKYVASITAPLEHAQRSLRRWNKKQQRAFLHASSVSTHSFHFLLAPFKPFYLSIRLFPLHSIIAIILSVGIFTGTYFLHELIFKDLPEVTDLSLKQPPISTRILDRNGQVLYRLYKDENRTIVPLTKINHNLVNATIAIEDKDFYSHHGFSIRGILRALLSNTKNGTTQGGSTLTQQLVKNRLLSSERTIQRKIKEFILAILVEGAYTKDEILAMYLNQVAYGGSTYGIEEASQRYFGKTAQELTLAEGALLAGIPAAPSVFSPFGPYPELAKERQHEVLRRMVEDGYITTEEAVDAMHESLSFQQDSIDIKAPHFVMYVRQLLSESYTDDEILQGGFEVRTTLDIAVQDEAQKIVTAELKELERLRINNGAALVTQPQTGEIFAMVGSKNYFDFSQDGQVNVTIRPRQPGSSIKPLTYALALERGSTVTSLISDQPVTYSIAGSPPYSPKNYDGKYHGNVTLKEALASSYNIPAVKTLDNVGISSLIDKAEKLGITTWKDRSRFGLSLTLGGGEVKMVELATAYSAFANQGKATTLNPILEIKKNTGEIVYRNTCALDHIGCPSKQAFDPRVAFLISNILSDNRARTPAFGPLSALYIPGQEVAVKTGTTNNLRDNWTIGYTSDRLVSVWVGNNDNKSMSYVASGVTGASPIWNKIMQLLLDKENPHVFAVPSGMVTMQACGKPKGSLEYYVVGTEPKGDCAVLAKNAVKKIDPAKKLEASL